MHSGTSGALTWTARSVGRSTEIRMEGEFDLAATAGAREGLEAALAEARTTVLLDLEAITFIDSTGLRFLLEVKRYLDGRKTELIFGNVSPIVRRLLDVAGLSTFFEVQDAPDNVVALFDAG